MSNEQAKHTAGPWMITRNGYHAPMVKTERYDIAEVYGPQREEREANAALIASAPSLLAENARLREALEDLAEALSDRSAKAYHDGMRVDAEIFLDFANEARAALAGNGGVE